MKSSDQPKYVQVKDYIKDYIRNGQLKENDRLFSEHELTKRFSVSRHTVRKAIGDLVNEGWLYTKQGKGTFISELEPVTRSNGGSNLVGVITTYLKDYIFPEIIGGIDTVLSEHGYNIMLGNTNNRIEKERLCLDNMLKNNISALIIEPTKSALPNPNIDLFDKLRSRGIPIVFIHGTYQNFPCSYVVEDDVYAGFIATKHLIDLGHNKIAGVFKSDDIQGHHRYQGFIKAHRECGVDINESSIVWYTTEDYKLYFEGREHDLFLINRIADSSGLVCYNDKVTLSVLKILRENGIVVPRDMSTVSFDNSRLARMSEVGLTTVSHPKSELGKVAAQAVISMINDPEYSIAEMMRPELVVRHSTQANK